MVKIALFLVSIYLISIAVTAAIALKQHVSEHTPAEKEDADKTLLGLEVVVLTLACAVLALFLFIAAFYEMEELHQALFIIFGFICFIAGALFSIKLEQIAGYYVCQKCDHTYVPNYTSVLKAPHFCRTRYMKCPNCKNRAWHKKRATLPQSNTVLRQTFIDDGM